MTTTQHVPEQLPAVDEFAQEVTAFLDTHARPAPNRAEFVWGEGSDEIALFHDTTPGEVQEARTFRAQLYDAGLGWLAGPPDYGGRGLPASYQRAYNAIERRYSVPNRTVLGVGLGMLAPTILEFGGEAVKRRWLVDLHRGDAVGCQLFSEPGAGSDLTAVSTKARRDGADWVVNGQKVWTTNAQFAQVGLLLAQTSDGPRRSNLTAFLLDMSTPGVDVRPLRQITGGSEFNEVFLDDVRIPDENRLGDVDGGWQVALATLAHERNAIGGAGSGGVGVLRFDRLLALVRESGMADDPVVRQLLARTYSVLRSSRFSRLRAEQAAKAGRRPGPEMSLGKLDLIVAMNTISELVTAVLGPSIATDTGEWGTYTWSQFFLGIPGLRFGGGTDEIQRNIIGERVLGLPKEPRTEQPQPSKPDATKESTR